MQQCALSITVKRNTLSYSSLQTVVAVAILKVSSTVLTQHDVTDMVELIINTTKFEDFKTTQKGIQPATTKSTLLGTWHNLT